jgi:hypothetical protein
LTPLRGGHAPGNHRRLRSVDLFHERNTACPRPGFGAARTVRERWGIALVRERVTGIDQDRFARTTTLNGVRGRNGRRVARSSGWFRSARTHRRIVVVIGQLLLSGRHGQRDIALCASAPMIRLPMAIQY